jgi:hypothetical protein
MTSGRRSRLKHHCTARRFRAVLAGLRIRHRRGDYRDPESQAFPLMLNLDGSPLLKHYTAPTKSRKYEGALNDPGGLSGMTQDHRFRRWLLARFGAARTERREEDRCKSCDAIPAASTPASGV